MERKRYKSAPLPFTGQKRMFLKHFEQVLTENIPNEGENWTIVDVFGGSGLLAHNAKHLKPKASVIYNDFDGYADRLKHISDINRLREILSQTIGDIIPKDKRLNKDLKEKIINKINGFNGFIDLKSLSAWVLFSGKQIGNLEDLFVQDFWDRIPKSNYPEAKDYLEGLEITNQPFQQLIPEFASNPKTLLILDPPYLCTRQDSYKQANYFDLIDFLRLIRMTKPPYLFFSSTKSELIRFIDYAIEDKADNWEIFDRAKRISIQTSASHNGKYEDNLVYKF